MPEIDEGTLRQLANVDAFVRRGLQHPQTRRKILEVQKTLNPDTAIPEIDEADPLHERINGLEEKVTQGFQALADQQREREEQQRLGTLTEKWTTGQALARKRGYSDEGLTNLEQFMEQNGILSHEVAIPAYEHLHPRPSPAISHGNRWDFFGPQPQEGLDLKPLYDGHEEQWLDGAITDTLNRVRSGG